MSVLFRTISLLLAGSIAISLLSACNSNNDVDGSHHSVARHINILDGRVGAIAPDGRIAWVDAQGDIEIKGVPQALSASQRLIASHYRKQAMDFQSEAVLIGRQGSDLGRDSLRDVASGLISGNTDHIGDETNVRAKQIDDHVRQLCQKLAILRDAQDELAQKVPVFAHYGTITAAIVEGCEPPDSARH